MNKTIKILGVMTLSLFLALNFASVVYALDSITGVDTASYKPLTTLPGAFEKGVQTNPVAVIAGIYGLAIGVGSVIAVIMIIYAGFQYMYQESIDGKSDAKQRIINAFLGLFVILGSYIILRTINPKLVEFDVALQGSNTGRLAGLSSAVRQADALAKAIHQASADRTVRLNEINSLKTDLQTKYDAVTALQQKIATTDPNSPEFQTLKKELDSSTLAITSAQQNINTKTLADLSITAEITSTVTRQNLLNNEILTLNKIVSGQEIRDEKVYQNVEAESKKSLEALSTQTTLQINTLSNLIESARKVEPTTEQEKKSQETFLTNTQQDIAYMGAARSMLEATKEIASETTTVIVGGMGGTTSQRVPTPVSTQSAKFDQVLNTYNNLINDAKKNGQTGFAQKLQRDLEAATQIMKLRNSAGCRDTGNQNLTLCAK